MDLDDEPYDGNKRRKLKTLATKPIVSGIFARSPNLLIYDYFFILHLGSHKNKMQKDLTYGQLVRNSLFTALILLY